MLANSFEDLTPAAKVKFNETESTIEVFSADFSKPSSNLKIRAISMLAESHPVTFDQAQRIFGLLHDGFTDSDGPVRQRAVRSVSHYCSRFPVFAPLALQALAQVFLKDFNQVVVVEATAAIQRILSEHMLSQPVSSEYASPQLVSFINVQKQFLQNHAFTETGTQAAVLLGFTSSACAIRPLCESMNHPNIGVQIAIARSFGRLALSTHDSRPGEYLQRMTELSRHPSVIVAAELELHTIQKFNDARQIEMQNFAAPSGVPPFPKNGNASKNGKGVSANVPVPVILAFKSH